jgi:hypothetical protein
MEQLLVVVAIVLLLLFCTYSEHFRLKHKHFPHAWYDDYVNDLEVTGVRLLNQCDQRLRVPPHPVDMRNQFMVRDDDSNIQFMLTQ